MVDHAAKTQWNKNCQLLGSHLSLAWPEMYHTLFFSPTKIAVWPHETKYVLPNFRNGAIPQKPHYCFMGRDVIIELNDRGVRVGPTTPGVIFLDSR